MKKLFLTLAVLAFVVFANAQKVSHTFNNVSISEALRQLNEQSADYTINFLYNELEDFRITTSLKNKNIPDAIQQMIGFYPIRMTVTTDDTPEIKGKQKQQIFVECTHKTDRHLTGSIIDEQGLPVAYANIAVLNPADSTLLSGGVSNESGYFAIPIEQVEVLVRISYVGYKTVYRLCDKPEVGTVRMRPDNYTINGVIVQGERPKVVLQGNSLVMNVESTVMERLGTAEDVLSRVPTISKKGEGYEILGKGAPLIYLNNRKLTDLNELRNIQSDFIRTVEVIQNPGARYDATVQAVIIIHTKRVQGEGLGVELSSWSSKGHGYVNNERINLTYRKGGLELFANLFGAYNKRWEKGEFEQTVFADTLWVINNRQEDHIHNPFLEGRFGFNYQLDDNNSFGGFYQNTYDYVKTQSEYDDDLTANGNIYDHLHNSGISRAEGVPKHQVNLYYTGKIGKMSIDFNADYTYRDQRNRNQQHELSENQDDRDVNTYALTRSRMAAEKLFVTHPIGKGQIEVGEEYTNTRWNSSFENAEGYIANSNNEQHESNIAPFIELRQQFGRFQLSAGLRYEHVESEYFICGKRRDDQSRTYNDLFPSVSVSTALKGTQFSFSYAKRTTRPTYWQLSSDVIYENRLNLQTGNPYLRPVKYHNVNAMAVWKWLYLSANYSHCIDPILYTAGSLESDSKVNLITRKNYDHADWLIVTLGAQKNIKLSKGETWTLQYNASLMKPWLKTTFLGGQKSFDQPMLSIQLGNIITLPHDWLLQGDFNVHTHGCTGANAISECTNPILTLSVSKDFFKRRLNVKLSGNDLFNGNIARFTLYSNQFMLRKVDEDDSRYVSLSLRYRFNVTPSKYKGTGAGNAEKNRL
ncbi:MAG: TonB-dependent receptor [Prevotella sp.]|nr:TonB-dependent receptor [Prevotella sp.]